MFEFIQVPFLIKWNTNSIPLKGDSALTSDSMSNSPLFFKNIPDSLKNETSGISEVIAAWGFFLAHPCFISKVWCVSAMPKKGHPLND